MSAAGHKVLPDAAFEDLGAFESVKVGSFTRAGNVIKGTHVVSSGSHSIELHECPDDHPSVVVHRSGDRIERIEFLCQCGRRTSVTLEYDAE